MSEDYYKTLIKDIIENNDKEAAIKIISNKLNEKQISNEKEMLNNLDKDKEIERLNNIIKLKTDFIAELLKIILVARDYELHEKCEVRAKLYEEKLQELKGSEKE